MGNFWSAGSRGEGLIITKLVQKARFGGFVRICGVDAIDISPDDELVGVHDMSDDGPRKIRTIAAKSGNAAIARCADESGNDGDHPGFKKRKENVAAAPLGLFNMRLRIPEGVASQDELRRGDRHGRDSRFF